MKALFSVCRSACIIFLILFSNFLFPIESKAQFLEAAIIGQQMNGDKTTSSEMALEVADYKFFGCAFGFNIDNINMNIDLLFGSTEIDMEEAELDVKMFGFDANVDYSFFKTSITPLVTLGIGSIQFTDSFTGAEKLNEVDFSYNVGAGIKWVVHDHYLLKGLYRATWTKIKETDNPIKLDGISINLGYVF